MYRLLILVPVLLLLMSCEKEERKITDVKDYERFLVHPPVKSLQMIDEEIRFWKKRFERNPDDIVSRSKIASLLGKRFARSGNIRELHQSDSLYKLVLAYNRNTSSSTFRSLAQNAITRHKFREAQSYIDSALLLGDDKYLSILIGYDVAMELGNYSRARDLLQAMENENAFEYLIRKSKYKDKVEGKQEEAVETMEKAYARIKPEGNKELWLWAKSNLGDMYTHANRLPEAYQAYLDVLKTDPGYHHALKGIGWLAFSHDKDVVQSRKIFEWLWRQHPVPDYLLQLGELAGYEGKLDEQRSYYLRFLEQVTAKEYGDMYNKYIVYLHCDELKNFDSAIHLAQVEVNNRPTPESYALLAWANFKKGNTKEALSLANSQVENRCHEPEVLYNLGLINLESDKKKSRRFLLQASESKNELGPVISKEIEVALNSMHLL
jgi:tetratricopeptide (TPR) repeat protein